ncbi:E3 ubiquitin-protein ligase MARCHF8-like isoform X1 [Teleopsis dalmanni]|uniref:E3 ubiquitin-protein ligase MARCHF8-like isoform X1 n=2 Tax=Teleopsis dalmanni TaxID=139649 RepID=UPI0018CE3B5C|nr:E3 ubiquitin-protein ligase MARCHF8-like isoform X1 [Teleopsis dalmanni]
MEHKNNLTTTTGENTLITIDETEPSKRSDRLVENTIIEDQATTSMQALNEAISLNGNRTNTDLTNKQIFNEHEKTKISTANLILTQVKDRAAELYLINSSSDTELKNVTRGLVRCSNTEDLTELLDDPTPTHSVHSIGSIVCRICHTAENTDKLVSPCLCKGSLTYVHIYCLERWISTSRSTTCELCQFVYNTEQTLRYGCLQSLRMWYTRAMSRRALQEDCQMFSLLTLVAFGIVGTLLVGIQHFIVEGRAVGISKFWTKSWLLFFLITTVFVYFMNVYMIMRSQLTPWYRWWQSARDIKLILENRNPLPVRLKAREPSPTESMLTMFSSTQSLTTLNENPSQTNSRMEVQQLPTTQIQTVIHIDPNVSVEIVTDGEVITRQTIQ